MKNDFLDELGELALGSRLKRLSERMMGDAGNVYEHFGLDVQPKWFTLLALLHDKKAVSVVHASEYLGLSQPAISQFCRQLVDKNLITLKNDERDSRRKFMCLTPSGEAQIQQMLPVWDAVRAAAENLCTELENDFYHALQKFEQALENKSLLQRTIEAYENK